MIEGTSGETSLNEEVHPMIVETGVGDNLSSVKSETSTSNSSNEQPLLALVDEASSTSTTINNETYVNGEVVLISDNVNSSSNSHETTTTTATEEEEDDSSKLNGSAACSSSDLLMMEVLAAKETLKKYLGNLSTGSGEVANNSSPPRRSKTKPEKRQSTSFEMNSLVKYGKTMCNSSSFRHRYVNELFPCTMLYY